MIDVDREGGRDGDPGRHSATGRAAGTDSAADLHWAYRVNPAWEKADKLTLHNNENVEVFVSQPAR